ncbi:MAG: class I SAM-dependent methyltransferase [Desulfovibrionaceae bacterium]|nr:class I SAM-dependent methyltransferase [Desulfovibrionaceae bacterium]MBF0514867.1 class I SAM-dependent methyltransferase [Desulfovibrionaceae bacterium]
MLRLYAPQSIAGPLGEFVAAALPQVRLLACSPVKRLDAGALRCGAILIAGAGRELRAPIALPFIPEDSEFLGLLDDIDWLYLGGDPEKLVGALSIFASRRGRVDVAYIAFAGLTGTLDRQPRPGEPRLAVKPTHANYNQQDWTRCKKDFLSTPEQDWASLPAANTRDILEHFGPWLARAGQPSLILDLGCGLGQSARSLAAMFPKSEVVGLDVSQDAIDVARAAFALPNLSFRVHGFDEALPFGDQSAGLIVSINALPYAADPAATADDIFRVLSPDGLFLNYCRLLLSQLALNFPPCLLWTHDHQLDPGDFVLPAERRGFRFALSQGRMGGLSPKFFISAELEDFKRQYGALAGTAPDFGVYRPWHSHAVTVAAREPWPGEALPDMQSGHLAKLGFMLEAVSRDSPGARELALTSWRAVAGACKLLPEAYAFMAACLPDQARTLDAFYRAAPR